jgi:ribosomal protein L18
MQRMVVREIHKFAPDAKLEIVRSNSHVIAQITSCQRVVRVCCSKTPKNEGHAILNIAKDVRRRLEAAAA